METQDPLKILCRVVDTFPDGVGEFHPVWKSGLCFYSLHSEGFIAPTSLTSSYGIVYIPTASGIDKASSNRNKYEN